MPRIMKNKLAVFAAVSLLLNVVFAVTAAVFVSKGYYRRYLKPYLRDYYIDRYTHFRSIDAKSGAIVFIGDSLTDRCEWAELFGRCDIVNRGIDGDTTDGVLDRLGEITARRPARIFIMIGGADILYGRSAGAIAENYRVIIERIKAESPLTRVYIQSLLPTLYRRVPLPRELITGLNDRLKALARERGVEYIDLHRRLADAGGDLNPLFTTDGVHLNGAGYIAWRNALIPYMPRSGTDCRPRR